MWMPINKRSFLSPGSPYDWAKWHFILTVNLTVVGEQRVYSRWSEWVPACVCVCMDGCNEDVTSLAVQPDTSSSIQLGGNAAHKPSWPYCAPAPRKSAASHLKKAQSNTAGIKPLHCERLTDQPPCIAWAGKCLDALTRISVYIFPIHGDASARALLVLSCAFVLNGFSRGPQNAPHCAHYTDWIALLWEKQKHNAQFLEYLCNLVGQRTMDNAFPLGLMSACFFCFCFLTPSGWRFSVQGKWLNWAIISARKPTGRWFLKTGLTPSLL